VSWKKLVLICVAILLPYLLLGFFNYPSADDYTYAVPVLEKGFWQAQTDWYNQWSGRFVSTAILSVSPVVFKSFLGYKLIGITTFFLYLAALYNFLSALVAGLFEKKYLQAFFVLFATVLISEIPSITESFHWFAGVVNYTWAFLVFLWGLGYYLKTRKISLAGVASLDLAKGRFAIPINLSIASFLLAGFNETLVVIWLYLIFIAVAAIWFSKKKWDVALFLPFLVGLVSFYFVFKAPGNAVRAAQFQGNHDILFTLFRPLGLFVEIFFRYLKLPFLLFLILIVPEVEALKNKVPQCFYNSRARWFSFVFFVSLVFLFLAPAHWAIGGAPPRRAMNILCFMYVSFTLWMYCQWVWSKQGRFLAKYQGLPQWAGRNTQLAALLLSFFLFSNHGVAWADLLFRAKDYAFQQQERIDLLEKATPESEIAVPPLRQRPETLFFSDLEPDPNDWINASVAGFFHVKSVRVDKSATK
jgi:uncharacterized protein DUF6056